MAQVVPVLSGGFKLEDFGYTPEENRKVTPMEERILAIDPSAPLSTEEQELRELYEFIERSTWFDQVLGIERTEHVTPGAHARRDILWAARRNLFGVKLPTKQQILAMANVSPQGT
jgi:hypothetical protein